MFRFESLLKLRENVRDEKAVLLKEIQQKVLAHSAILAEQNKKIEQDSEYWRQEQSRHSISVDRLLQSRHHREHLLAVREQLIADQLVLEREQEERYRQLNESIRDVKILEKLRERQETAQRVEDGKKEQKFLDELAHLEPSRPNSKSP